MGVGDAPVPTRAVLSEEASPAAPAPAATVDPTRFTGLCVGPDVAVLSAALVVVLAADEVRGRATVNLPGAAELPADSLEEVR